MKTDAIKNCFAICEVHSMSTSNAHDELEVLTDHANLMPELIEALSETIDIALDLIPYIPASMRKPYNEYADNLRDNIFKYRKILVEARAKIDREGEANGL